MRLLWIMEFLNDMDWEGWYKINMDNLNHLFEQWIVENKKRDDWEIVERIPPETSFRKSVRKTLKKIGGRIQKK
jgi:hypothetical protein